MKMMQRFAIQNGYVYILYNILHIHHENMYMNV